MPTKQIKPAAGQAAKTIAAPDKKAAAAEPAIKPIKEVFNKTTLTAHLAKESGVDTKDVKLVLAALEATVIGSLHKKGSGEFSLPGVFRLQAEQIPARKARKGINPFTKQEQTFAAKPAAVKLRARFFKKVKDVTH